jgi:CRISPR-associated endonuclease/helicase Cas3
MAVESRLIHGNSWLLNEKVGLIPATTENTNYLEDARAGRDWFASAKRALLAPFGVGTVDQALLGVVAAKHFFVRQYALAGKVVIIDEVHSYDLYTGTIIDRLIQTLEGLGCTVIVLSATLTEKRRNQLIPSRESDADPADQPYPLISAQVNGQTLPPVAALPPKNRQLEILFEPEELAVSQALEVAEKGGCVLWICNTVDAAQRHFLNFQERAGKRFPIGLLHSRFPFWRREELENEWMERLGKSGNTRCGSILVSTQIVEQSVDLDADLLISELAPTDMLLQRTGRLWRHEREQRPISGPRLIILEETASLDELRGMESAAILKVLGGKAYVYDPYVLLRTLVVWKGKTQVTIPSQIRSLIEETYECLDDEPESWEKLFDNRFATDSGKRFLATLSCNLWKAAGDDKEGYQTRLIEVQTLSLVLYRSQSRTAIKFIDDTTGILAGEDFHLPTAQGIHRNLVKIAAHYFEKAESILAIARYLHDEQRIGLVGDDGSVTVKGLKEGVRLFWSIDQGLVVENNKKEERS